jgi:hypothetical protein
MVNGSSKTTYVQRRNESSESEKKCVATKQWHSESTELTRQTATAANSYGSIKKDGRNRRSKTKQSLQRELLNFCAFSNLVSDDGEEGSIARVHEQL